MGETQAETENAQEPAQEPVRTTQMGDMEGGGAKGKRGRGWQSEASMSQIKDRTKGGRDLEEKGENHRETDKGTTAFYSLRRLLRVNSWFDRTHGLLDSDYLGPPCPGCAGEAGY